VVYIARAGGRGVPLYRFFLLLRRREGHVLARPMLEKEVAVGPWAKRSTPKVPFASMKVKCDTRLYASKSAAGA